MAAARSVGLEGECAPGVRLSCGVAAGADLARSLRLVVVSIFARSSSEARERTPPHHTTAAVAPRAPAHTTAHTRPFPPSRPSRAMVFVLRVRDPSGMHRLVFPSESASWRDLQQQVEDVCKVPIEAQKLSRTPLHAPEYIDAPATTTLKALKMGNGDVLFLSGHTPETLAARAAAINLAGASAASSSSSSSSSASAAAASSSSAAAPTYQLTSRCNHGPRGACPYWSVATHVDDDGGSVNCLRASG